MRMGSTQRSRRGGGTPRDYPHTHGEHPPRPWAGRSSPESSPYAWGTPDGRLRHVGAVGIIPIRMGNTRRSPSWRRRQGDHPHTHGEHQVPKLDYPRLKGSSPYAWGTLDPELAGENTRGIIPIRMGNTVLHRPFNHEFAFFSFTSRPPSRLPKNELEPCAGLRKCYPLHEKYEESSNLCGRSITDSIDKLWMQNHSLQGVCTLIAPPISQTLRRNPAYTRWGSHWRCK